MDWRGSANIWRPHSPLPNSVLDYPDGFAFGRTVHWRCLRPARLNSPERPPMTTNRTDPHAGFVDPATLPRGPRGLPCCRRCGREVEAPRQTFCSESCLHEHLLRTSQAYARRCVEERDRGICQRCGRDTRLLTEIYRWAKQHYDDLFPCLAHLRAWGGPWFQRRVFSHFFHGDLATVIGVTRTGGAWEMDHEIPVAEGGGECGLENLRTLCVPCHRKVTRDLRRRLARRPKDPETSPYPTLFV
jgi:5-methylcytosine-specific restriction enzyme A